MNKESVFFGLIPYEVGIIILAGFVMMVLLTIKNIKDKNKICQRCQSEIENHK